MYSSRIVSISERQLKAEVSIKVIAEIRDLLTIGRIISRVDLSQDSWYSFQLD